MLTEFIEADPGMQLLLSTLREHVPQLPVETIYSRDQLAQLKVRRSDLIREMLRHPRAWSELREVVTAARQGHALTFTGALHMPVEARHLKTQPSRFLNLTLNPGLHSELLNKWHFQQLQRLRGQPTLSLGYLTLLTALPTHVSVDAGGRFAATSDEQGPTEMRRWHCERGTGLMTCSADELEELARAAAKADEPASEAEHLLDIQVTVNTNLKPLRELQGETMTLGDLLIRAEKIREDLHQTLKINPAEIRPDDHDHHLTLSRAVRALQEWTSELQALFSPQQQALAVKLLRAGPELTVGEPGDTQLRPEDGWPLTTSTIRNQSSPLLTTPALLRGVSGVQWAMRELGMQNLRSETWGEPITTGDLALHELSSTPGLLGHSPTSLTDLGEQLRQDIRAGLDHPEYPWQHAARLWSVVRRFPHHGARWMSGQTMDETQPGWLRRIDRDQQLGCLRGQPQGAEGQNPTIHASYRGWWTTTTLRMLSQCPQLRSLGELMEESQNETLTIPSRPNSTEGLVLNRMNIAAIGWQLCRSQIISMGHLNFGHDGFERLNLYASRDDVLLCSDITHIYSSVMNRPLDEQPVPT